jgi:hypothetical protein
MKTRRQRPIFHVLLLIPCVVALAAGAHGSACNPPPGPTFTVFLPKVGLPPDEEGLGWVRPPVWEHLPDATDDSITVPNGRPIYALIVSGFGSNKYLDQLMVYNFARHLMARGAYVHYAWWNNLLAPYMERPLHHSQSHPGGLSAEALGNFLTAADASNKAAPGEDYQFVADAKLFLSAIRQNNPNAIIIVVGHSMGGGSVVHLGAQTDVVIDILAPFDPTNNRNYPWSGPLGIGPPPRPDFNWTRWRVTRDTFLGYQSAHWGGIGVGCVASGPWLKDVNDRNNDLPCADTIFVHDAPTLQFGSRVINLHHGWQHEWFFPFDYLQTYTFGHSPPPGGSTWQMPIPTTPEFCGFLQRCADPGGWPANGDTDRACCETGEGVGWPRDGHGEIVGYRGPLPDPVPLGVRVQTSPQCVNCPNEVWPARSESNGTWSNGDGAGRVALLQALEALPEATPWDHRPTNPHLCLVSPGLIHLFDIMNKPPVADAGGDQTVECDGLHSAQVTLDGSKSTDPDGDNLDYRWTWDTGSVSGAVVTVRLPVGTHCARLTVRDPSGHMDRRVVTVTVADMTPPDLSVQLSPRVLWPVNHKMVNIHATVESSDRCGRVAELKLLSIVSNQGDNGGRAGNTTHDIVAKIGTLDQNFQLRADRAGSGGDRIYTVTYQATDDSGNQARVSQEVVVPHDHKSYEDWLKAMKN